MGAFATNCVALRFSASAAEFTYKLATPTPPTAPVTLRALDAATRINRDSGGRIEIQVYPNQELGGDLELLTQVRLGAVEFYTTGNTNLASLVPAAGLDSLPFIFSSYDDAWRASDGAMGKYVRAEILKTGLFPFEKTWDAGFRQIVSSLRPIVSPDDLKGLRIRVPSSPVLIALFKTLGASPTPLSYKDIYPSLQTHLIDAVDTGYTIVESGKLYEVLKYASETNHVWTGDSIVGNLAAWQRLPQKLRDIIERRFDEAALMERSDQRSSEVSSLGQLRKQGLIYNKADLPALRTVIRRAGLYAQWRSSFGTDAWAALEKSVGTL